MDARLPDNSRVNIVLPPVAVDGTPWQVQGKQISFIYRRAPRSLARIT